MSKKILLKISLFFIILVIGCNTSRDYNLLKSEILNLHKTGINAHLIKDIDFFTKDISDDYFSVNNGEIRHPTKEEITRQFTRYLNNTEFDKYEDIQEPIIGFSEDGTLAYSLVRVKIEGERKYENDTISNFDFICAWITLYKREGDNWIRLGEVSNFQ